MTCWPEEATPEGGDQGAKQAVSPKPPPPKAPITYWRDQKVENESETGEGKGPKEQMAM